MNIIKKKFISTVTLFKTKDYETQKLIFMKQINYYELLVLIGVSNKGK